MSGETDRSPAQRHGHKESSLLLILHIPELPSPPPGREGFIGAASGQHGRGTERGWESNASRQVLRCCDIGPMAQVVRLCASLKEPS